MRFISKVTGLAVCGLAAAALYSPAQAVPISLATLISTNGTITDGDKQFSNFSCSNTPTGNTSGGCSALNVDKLSIQPGETDPGLHFTGTLQAIGNGSSLDTVIGYTVTVLDPNQSIKQISLGFNGSFSNLTNVNDATVTTTEQVKSGSTIVGNTTVSAPVDLQDPPFEMNSDIPLTSTFKTLNITKDILISTHKDGVSGTISVIDQDFQQTGTSVPEPTVLGLLGAGLISLGAVIRRRRAA